MKFCNCYGIYLLIDVSDHAQVLLIEEDLALLDKQDLDTFRPHVMNSLETYLSKKMT